MVIHICSPQVYQWEIRRWKCPNCGKRKMLAQYFEWYGPSVGCLNCGDCWNDGELQERPFARGWRQRSVQELQRRLTMLARDAGNRASKNADTQRLVLSVSQGEQKPALQDVRQVPIQAHECDFSEHYHCPTCGKTPF